MNHKKIDFKTIVIGILLGIPLTIILFIIMISAFNHIEIKGIPDNININYIIEDELLVELNRLNSSVELIIEHEYVRENDSLELEIMKMLEQQEKINDKLKRLGLFNE